MSNSQLDKLGLAIKSAIEGTLKLLSNMVGDSNNDTNFPYKLLLTGRKV